MDKKDKKTQQVSSIKTLAIACLVLSSLIIGQPLLASSHPEPEVTIRQEKDKTIEEYRINGQLYAIKVTPKNGQPYYLVDSDGNSDLDLRQERGKLIVPKWLLFRW